MTTRRRRYEERVARCRPKRRAMRARPERMKEETTPSHTGWSQGARARVASQNATRGRRCDFRLAPPAKWCAARTGAFVGGGMVSSSRLPAPPPPPPTAAHKHHHWPHLGVGIPARNGNDGVRDHHAAVGLDDLRALEEHHRNDLMATPSAPHGPVVSGQGTIITGEARGVHGGCATNTRMPRIVVQRDFVSRDGVAGRPKRGAGRALRSPPQEP